MAPEKHVPREPSGRNNTQQADSDNARYSGDVSKFIGLVDVMTLAASGCKMEMQVSDVGRDCNLLIKHFPEFAEMIDYHRGSPDQFVQSLKSRGVHPEVFMDQVMSIQNDMNAIRYYLD